MMSLVTDSPVNSSSSDDFAAFLDDALDASSSKTSLVDEAQDDDEIESLRVKRCKVENIQEPQGSTSHLTMEQQCEVSSKKKVCVHPGSYGGMCIGCGKRLEGESGVTFRYIHKGLKLQNEEISRLRRKDMKNLLRHKKLLLVLDLDQTLLNSTRLVDLTSEEGYLVSQTDSLEDVSKGNLFMLAHMGMMTKLRPSVRAFLKEASKMFEMYIYTMGDRDYALEMAKLLDPRKEYFHSGVISRDDGTQRHQKGLDIVLGEESAVLILDDTEHAWMSYQSNLILMERYHFFGSSCRQFNLNCKSLAELKCDESESDGALTNILKLLKRIHHIFFDEPGDDNNTRDVRQLLRTIRKEVLKGCKIVFSHVFPTSFQASDHPLWKMAEQMGAACVLEPDPSVTHVVANDAGTKKSRWAVSEKKFLVHPRWIEAAYYFWEKQPEENFTLDQAKKQ